MRAVLNMACVGARAIRMRVSRSTDERASLIPRKVRVTDRALSSRLTSGSRPEAMPMSRILVEGTVAKSSRSYRGELVVN
jgi:hypothetical protein